MIKSGELVRDHYWKRNTLVIVFVKPVGGDTNTVDKLQTLFSSNYLEVVPDWRDDVTLELHNLDPKDEEKMLDNLLKAIEQGQSDET